MNVQQNEEEKEPKKSQRSKPKKPNDDNEENSIFALKCQEIFDGEITAKLQREIDIMSKLKANENENVLQMIDYFLDDGYLLILLPFFDSNLESLLSAAPLKMDLIKNIMFQTLNGLAFIHSLNILHRDLKPNNILYRTQSQQIRIADFGSSRDITSILEEEEKKSQNQEKENDNNSNSDPKEKEKDFSDPEWNGFASKESGLSPQIVVVMYRSPELLLGERHYSFPLDIWSIGCIMARMCRNNGTLLFDQTNDIPLFLQQIDILGGPPPNELDHVGLFSSFFQMESKEYNPINKILPHLNQSQTGCDLLHKILTFSPKKRISAKQALTHKFFETLKQ